jgi:tetratricopeptide (TPR) repeat protein
VEAPVAAFHLVNEEALVKEVAGGALVTEAGERAGIGVLAQERLDAMAAGEQFVHEVRTDKPGSAGDETFHSKAAELILQYVPLKKIKFHKKFSTLDLASELWKFSSRSMQAKNGKKPRANTRELDVKIGFMEGILRRDPNYVDALQLLGDHYTQRGRFVEGLTVDERLAQLEPENPVVFYNLACSYSLTDQFDRAAQALQKAIALGYQDFEWLAKDPDLKKFRQQPAFQEIMKKIPWKKIKIR